MKALLLIEDDRIADIVRFYLKPLGFEALHYRNPVKAIDNLEEIGPDALIVSARDFPRHWKVLAQVLRATRTKEDCVILLLKGDIFPFEEAAKASQLGVNGILRDALDDRRELEQFERLLRRYVAVEEPKAIERLSPSPLDRLDFMFAHPRSLAPVAGRLESVSLDALVFLPNNPAAVSDIEVGTLLDDCSLRSGDKILSLSCKVVRADRVMGLAVLAMSSEERACLKQYLEARPEREMRALLDKGKKI